MEEGGHCLTGRSKTSRSPREGTRPTRFPRKSACIVGPVPSPGGFFNRLLVARASRPCVGCRIRTADKLQIPSSKLKNRTVLRLTQSEFKNCSRRREEADFARKN